MADNVWLGTDVTTPNSWSVAANWSLAHVPIATENVWFPAGNSVSVTAGLNQATIVLASLNIDPSYTGKIGVLSGVVVTYLQIQPTILNMPAASAGTGAGAGSTLIAIDSASSALTANIQQSNTADVASIRLKGTAITLNQTGGSVAIAAYPGETSTVTTARLSNGPNDAAPSLLLGAGVTLTDAYMEAGALTSYSANVAPSIRIAGGIYDYRGTGAHSQLDVDAGACLYTGTGTLNGNCNVRGVLDFRQDDRAKVVTNPIILHAGSSLFADTRYVTAPAAAPLAFKTYHCRVSDISAIDLGTNVSLTAVAA